MGGLGVRGLGACRTGPATSTFVKLLSRGRLFCASRGRRSMHSHPHPMSIHGHEWGHWGPYAKQSVGWAGGKLLCGGGGGDTEAHFPNPPPPWPP